jgi:hypothetical protein
MAVQTKQEALVLTRLTVTTKLAEQLRDRSAAEIDTSLTFTDPTPNGYGRTEQRYYHLVVVIAAELQGRSGRDVVLDDPFARDHLNKAIDDFIFDAAGILINSPLSAHG